MKYSKRLHQRYCEKLVAQAVCVAAGPPVAASATWPEVSGTVFYIDKQNHNLTQPGGVTSPEQLF